MSQWFSWSLTTDINFSTEKKILLPLEKNIGYNTLIGHKMGVYVSTIRKSPSLQCMLRHDVSHDPEAMRESRRISVTPQRE